MNNGWANNRLTTSERSFETLHSGLTVELIATPRSDFMTCRADELVSSALKRNTEPYDYLPVVASAPGGDNQIVGLLYAVPFFGEDTVNGYVSEYFSALSEESLIGADASILAFIRDADAKPCRMVVSGPHIKGLVSLSDLQKLPVRAALFALITGFEITMAQSIRCLFRDGDGWMECLSNARREKIAGEIAKSHHDDGFVDNLLFTQFCDKADILVKKLPLPTSKRELRQKLREIQKLRDSLAHANQYAATPRHARRVCAIVRNLIALEEEILAAASSDTAP